MSEESEYETCERYGCAQTGVSSCPVTVRVRGVVRGSQSGCAGVCLLRTRAWSQRGCPRSCGNVTRKGRRGEPDQTLRQSTGLLPAGHHVLGLCPLPRRPRLLTDSNPFATGPSVPRLPGLGRRVRPPTSSSGQAPPSARHMEGQACKTHRETRGQEPRRRPGPAPRKCGWATGGYSPKGLAEPLPRNSDISPDTRAEPRTAARAPGHMPRSRPVPPTPSPGQPTGSPGPRPRGRAASPRLSHLNLAHARPAARHR